MYNDNKSELTAACLNLARAIANQKKPVEIVTKKGQTLLSVNRTMAKKAGF